MLATKTWKTFIENTPRTLKHALPILISKLSYSVSLGDPLDNIAYNSIKSFCSKYGITFFGNVVDIINDNMNSPKTNSDAEFRCDILVLNEFIKSVPNEVLLKYQADLLAMIKNQIFSKDAHLRKAVFNCFKSVVDRIGN